MSHDNYNMPLEVRSTILHPSFLSMATFPQELSIIRGEWNSYLQGDSLQTVTAFLTNQNNNRKSKALERTVW